MNTHFNNLTPAEAERLAMLAEEAGEIVQAVGKVLRHGNENTHPDGGPTNREQLEMVLVDLFAVMSFMIAKDDLPDILSKMDGRAKDVMDRKLRYTHHQQELD